jgi:hypothetical protein
VPYTNPRGLPLTDIGEILRTTCRCTLVDYTSGGTTQPAVGDIVTFSATGDWYVKRAADDVNNRLGRVTKIEKAPVGTDEGLLVITWLDIVRFVEVACSNLALVTRGNSAIKAGADTVANDFDAQATTGNLVVVAKSAASGAGTAVCAVVAR